MPDHVNLGMETFPCDFENSTNHISVVAGGEVISANGSVRVLGKVVSSPIWECGHNTGSVIVQWTVPEKENTVSDRRLKLLHDVLVPAQNAFVVYEAKPVKKTVQNTQTQQSPSLRDELAKLNFFHQVLTLQQNRKIDTALRYMFKTVDQLFLEKRFGLCNELLRDPKALELNKDLQIGMLVATLPWKSILPSRDAYFSFVRKTFLEMYSEDKSDKLLSGLI